VKLKKLYSSREVAQLTGLTARQLQWWAKRNIFSPAVPSHKTDAGGFTERRYTPIELLELMVLADLRRKGFSVARIRKLLQVLRTRFKTRLYEAIEGGGPVTLYIDPSTSSGSPRAKSRGEVRKTRLSTLMRHPAPRWRPLASNTHFVGVFRLDPL
jgi:DNA-binding transcriptional MerR regulator